MSVDGICFSKKDYLLNKSKDGTYSVPDQINGATVTSIADGTFSDCNGLISLSIPDSVLSIGARAFANCRGLTSVSIPDSVTSIGDGAFSNCTVLVSITIPGSVTSIGARAFRNCRSLTSIYIPDSVTNIGATMFRTCSNMATVRISNNVSKIDEGTFYDCSSLTSVSIPDKVQRIGARAFAKCIGLTTVNIPDKVTRIKAEAFAGCSEFIRFTLSIPLRAFPEYDSALSNEYKLSTTFGKIFEYLSFLDLIQMTMVSKCFYYEIIVRFRREFVHERNTSIGSNTETLSITFCDENFLSTCVSKRKDELAFYACKCEGIESVSYPLTFLQPEPTIYVLPPEF